MTSTLQLWGTHKLLQDLGSHMQTGEDKYQTNKIVLKLSILLFFKYM